MPLVKQLFVGETARLTALVYDADGELADPTNSMVIRVMNPDKIRVVTDDAMNRSSIGSYSYLFQIPEASTVGLYTFELISTDGSDEIVSIGDGSWMARARIA